MSWEWKALNWLNEKVGNVREIWFKEKSCSNQNIKYLLLQPLLLCLSCLSSFILNPFLHLTHSQCSISKFHPILQLFLFSCFLILMSEVYSSITRTITQITHIIVVDQHILPVYSAQIKFSRDQREWKKRTDRHTIHILIDIKMHIELSFSIISWLLYLSVRSYAH